MVNKIKLDDNAQILIEFEKFLKYNEDTNERVLFDKDCLSTLHYDLYRYRKAFHLLSENVKIDNIIKFGFTFGMCLMVAFDGKWHLDSENKKCVIQVTSRSGEIIINPLLVVSKFLKNEHDHVSLYDLCKELVR